MIRCKNGAFPLMSSPLSTAMRPPAPVSAQEDLFTAAAEGPKAADKVEAEVQMGNWVDPWYRDASMTPQT